MKKYPIEGNNQNNPGKITNNTNNTNQPPIRPSTSTPSNNSVSKLKQATKNLNTQQPPNSSTIIIETPQRPRSVTPSLDKIDGKKSPSTSSGDDSTSSPNQAKEDLEKASLSLEVALKRPKAKQKNIKKYQESLKKLPEIMGGIKQINHDNELKRLKKTDNNEKQINKITSGKLHNNNFLFPALIPNVREKEEYKNAVIGEKIPLSHEGHEYNMLKLGYPYFYDEQLIPGANKHKHNANINFSVSPCAANNHKITGNTSAEQTENWIQFGKEYLKDVINSVDKSYKKGHNGIRCIILGNQEKEENSEAYKALGWEKCSDNTVGSNIQHYILPKDKSGAVVNVDAYYIHAHGHEMNVTSKDLELLYKICYEASAADKSRRPIIVHCQQGLDRTGMFIMAMELFRCSEFFFTEKDPKGSAARIYIEAYLRLLESRSPVALTKVGDFENALYLAHTFQAIEFEQICLKGLYALAEKDKAGDKIKTLVTNLQEANSIESKLDIVTQAMKSQGIENYKNNGKISSGVANGIFANSEEKLGNKLATLKCALEFRQEAEATLQARIQPKEEIVNTSKGPMKK